MGTIQAAFSGAFGLLVATCATPSAAADPPANLVARWSITALASRPASPAGDITFKPDGKVQGATACNMFHGTYEADGAGALTIAVAQMTLRGCSGVAAERERGFIDAMRATHGYRIDADQLALTAADGAALAQLVRTPDAALEGVRHKIVSYFKDGGLYSAKAETPPWLKLTGGAISGNTGCRSFSARYLRDGTRLTITDIAAALTRAPCHQDITEQDDAILAALPRVTTFDTSRNLVRLLEKPDGAAMLWITPAGE